MILQLNPTIDLETPKGRATAHFVIDYSEEKHLAWVCFIHATGECWSFENPAVRLCANETRGTKTESPREHGETLFCSHCGIHTPHLCHDSGHERDSSGDRRKCLLCGKDENAA